MSLIGKAKRLVAEQRAFRATDNGSQLDARLVAVVEALLRELNTRELHHFEVEEALARIKWHIYAALHEYGDDLDHQEILDMIPEDI